MAVPNARRLQKRQWERDETNLRRDVLRRLFEYRLTESLKGGDGEPFIALNEAWIAYASFPHVTKALTKCTEARNGGPPKSNIAAVVRAMADAVDISLQDLDDRMIEHPFTPPAANREP